MSVTTKSVTTKSVTTKSVTTKEEKTKEYLKRYKVYKQMLAADEYAEEYGGTKVPLCDKIFLKAKMSEIEHFIRALPVSREQTMLFNHFVRGHSVEFCGEMMYLSRRTAYRVAKRAIALAALHYRDQISADVNIDAHLS